MRKVYYPAPPKQLAIVSEVKPVNLTTNFFVAGTNYAIREYDKRYRKRILTFLYENSIDVIASNQLNLPEKSPAFIAYQTLAYPYAAVGIIYYPDLYYVEPGKFVVIRSHDKKWYGFQKKTAELMLEAIGILYGIKKFTPELLAAFRLPENSPIGKMVISKLLDQKLSGEEIAIIANGYNIDKN